MESLSRFEIFQKLWTDRHTYQPTDRLTYTIHSSRIKIKKKLEYNEACHLFEDGFIQFLCLVVFWNLSMDIKFKGTVLAEGAALNLYS